MQAITLVHADGSRWLACFVPLSFDVQAWAERRRASFALLGVVRVVTQES